MTMKKISATVLSFFVFALSICLQAQSAATASVAADAEASWAERLLTGRDVLASSHSLSTKPLLVTPNLEKGKEAVYYDVDVTGCQQLWLTAGYGGDGNGGDHTCWVDPVFTREDGTTASGLGLPMLVNSVQWQRLFVNSNFRREPISIGGKIHQEGWWAHSLSYLCLKLDGQFKSFRVGVGADKAWNAGKYMHFEIHAALPPDKVAGIFAQSLAQDFPVEERWLRQDLGVQDGGHAALFASGLTAVAVADLVTAQAKRLGMPGQDYRQRLAAMPKNDKREDLAALLAFYHDVRRAATIIDDADKSFELARKSLAFVEKSRALPAEAAALAALTARAAALPERPDGSWPQLLSDLKALRRRIILSHPLLDFTDLLINKQPPTTYSHQCDQYLGRHSRSGPGLVVLRNWKSAAPEAVELLKDKLPTGSVAHPDLSYDGKKILFSYCDHSVENRTHRRYFIWEINSDGTGLRQLTGTANDAREGEGGRDTVLVEDFDPCYLPDGNIVFVSTRCQAFGRCHHRRYNPSYLLYLMNGDGGGIRLLSFGEANEWDPSVLPDGRIIFSRWDYINRHDTFYQSLWTIRPDGTNTAHYYGNYTINPCMLAEARAIPDSRQVVCTAMAHHSYTAGSIIALDPSQGEDGPKPITRLTPETRFPETEGWPEGVFCTPWPLSEDLVLAAYTPEKLAMQGKVQSAHAYGIVLIDSLGGREEIYRDPAMSSVSPMPLQPRPEPVLLSSTLPPPLDEQGQTRPGLLYIQNAALGRMDFGAPIKALRVNSIIGQPTPSVPHRGAVRQEIVKRVEGTVPVNPDGSAFFHVPSGVPIQLQALDEQGMAVMTMRSFIFTQPGETLSCIGCHEDRALTPPPRSGNAGAPKALTPSVNHDYPGGFSYLRSVQPIFDRHCISCHGLGQAQPDLRGTPVERPVPDYPGWPGTVRVATSYNELINRPGMVKIAQRNVETAVSKPRDYFAHAGKLMPFLLQGHCPALLADKDAVATLITWLDLNAQYHGDYSFARREDISADPAGEKALRDAVRERFGEAWAAQPYACLVNVANPAQSRVLMAALPAAVGGWGQVAAAAGAFTGRDDPTWLHFRDLVEQSMAPYEPPAADGTCKQSKCICGSCWVPAQQMK